MPPHELIRLSPGDVRLPMGRLHLPSGSTIVLSEEVSTALMTFLALEASPGCPTLLCGRRSRPLGPVELCRAVGTLGRNAHLDVSPWSLHLGALYRALPHLPDPPQLRVQY